jgi:hypothetical protein
MKKNNTTNKKTKQQGRITIDLTNARPLFPKFTNDDEEISSFSDVCDNESVSLDESNDDNHKYKLLQTSHMKKRKNPLNIITVTVDDQ